jgi:ribosomal protein L29
MNKEKEQAQEQQQTATGTAAPESATIPAGSPAGETTPVILRAKSREELNTQFQQLKAKHDGKTLTSGAVARNSDDGTYILRIDII